MLRAYILLFAVAIVLMALGCVLPAAILGGIAWFGAWYEEIKLAARKAAAARKLRVARVADGSNP